MLRFSFYLFLLGYSFSEAADLKPLSDKVLGTIVTSCERSTFHTPYGTPYPTHIPDNGPIWVTDPRSFCQEKLTDVLDYCRTIYALDHPESIDSVILDPFLLPAGIMPHDSSNLTTSSMHVYLCLGPSSDSNNLYPKSVRVELISPPLPAKVHHQPSLIDVHRTYFAEQFRQLSNESKVNVSHLIENVTKEAKGLAHLHRTNPKLTGYVTSHILQNAHHQLERIWLDEENRWSDLEQAQHVDLVKLLQSEDWASENEFVYVLQEFPPNLDRIQDAVARLLSRLADSVSEEIRHLNTVQEHQPWLLTLGVESNWTTHITNRATSLERVHEALLKHVNVAAKAINTLRPLMHKDAETNGAPPSLRRYKPSLVANYDTLQSKLFEAQKLLNNAKSTLLDHVARRMQSNLANLNSTLSATPSPISPRPTTVEEWIQSKHHNELAYIDFLMTQLIKPYAAPADLPIGMESNDLWTPNVAFGFNPLTVVPPNELDIKGQLLTFHSALPLILIIAVSLFAVIILTTCCYLASTKCRRSHARNTRLRDYLAKWGHKLWHLFSNEPRTRQLFVPGSPDWRVGHQVVVIPHLNEGSTECASSNITASTLLIATCQSALSESNATDEQMLLHGYMNPTCSDRDGN